MNSSPTRTSTPDTKRTRATIAVIGTNYVGLVTAACLAQLGHNVIGIDVDAAKVARLRQGELPFHEPGLQALVAQQLEAQRLHFTLDYAGVALAEFAFVCVGTPPLHNGDADMTQVRAVTRGLACHARPGARLVVVNKSTMPVGTGKWMQATLDVATRATGATFAIVSNPEFLREGSAVADFQHPDRIVLGGDDSTAVDAVADLYQGLQPAPPIVRTDLRTAEMIKYASNAFLATKISFINEMAAICDRLGADVTTVAEGMGLDARIGPRFLTAGVGFGGSCFPKDVTALIRTANRVGATPRLLQAVMTTNRQARKAVVSRLRGELGGLRGRNVAILGLAFKAATDDTRESPAIAIARQLLREGARVRAFDPQAAASAVRVVRGLDVREDAYQAVHGADALLILTDWPEFQALDFARIRNSMRQPIVLDGRNLLDPPTMHALGFRYLGIGRGATRAADAVATLAA